MIPGAEITVRADDINMGTQTPISITIKGQDLDTLEICGRVCRGNQGSTWYQRS